MGDGGQTGALAQAVGSLGEVVGRTSEAVGWWGAGGSFVVRRGRLTLADGLRRSDATGGAVSELHEELRRRAAGSQGRVVVWLDVEVAAIGWQVVDEVQLMLLRELCG